MYRIALSIAFPEITHQPLPHCSVTHFLMPYCLCQIGANQLHNIAFCFGLRNARKEQRHRFVEGFVVASEQKSETSVTHERKNGKSIRLPVPLSIETLHPKLEITKLLSS